MKLRPYQTKQVEELRLKFRQGKKRIVLCSPTGSGKTVTFTELIRLTLAKSDSNRVLVLTDRIELFKQTWKTLSSIGIEPFVYSASAKNNTEITSRCVVAMIETLKRRAKSETLRIGQFDIIIIDEAHKGNFKKVFEIYPDAYYIGATATPLATSKKDPLKNYYDDIVNVIDIPELIRDGHLVDEQVFMMKLIDNEKLKYDSGKGDFTERSQFEAFNELRIYTGMINAYNQKALGKKTIVFCPNIEMSEIVAKQFESVLDNVFCLTSKNTKEERKQILSDYHASSDGIMVNCGILTTGYDHPQIECVILFRATTSLPLFFQMVGRGSRPSKGKDLLTVIDLGENCERIGLWSDSKDWTDLFWNPPKKGIPQPAPTKECPKCQSLLPVQVMQCRYCGNQFKSKERELAEGVLIEVKSAVNKKMYDLTVDEMIKLVKSKVLSEHYVARVLRSKRGGYYDLIEYSQKMNKSQGFITYNMSAPKGAKNTLITAEFIQEKLSDV